MIWKHLTSRGINLLVLAGILMAACFIALVPLPSLRGSYTPTFLVFFLLASGGYTLAIFRLNRDRVPIKVIFGFAIAFRFTLLFTSPSLSDDVYRYVWDGHLLNSGINPYALPVNSQVLDAFDIPLRALVNHNWMASPYLPVAQLVFAVVEFLIPQNILVFRATAVLFDLLTGWLVLDILRRLRLPGRNVLIYLWNPLVIIEFADGAHVDAVMIFFIMFAFWFLLKETHTDNSNSFGSTVALAAATLTKFVPVLLVPIFWWRWEWKNRIVFGSILLLAVGLFVPGAGFGIVGPLDGTGVFGALRIYFQWWNFNSGIYHWLEVLISGYTTPGAVPVEIVGQTPIYIAKAITVAFLGIAVFLTGWVAWKINKSDQQNNQEQVLILIRLAMVPLGAYLLFTATIHPWYVILIIPLLPFLYQKNAQSPNTKPFIWPWIYFSIAVTLSYLTYLDPNNLRETTWVRLVEYIPFYALLGWAIGYVFVERKKLGVYHI
jgi:4-amino-4-deoxy-L-arabinose transferase-like glycosyltransferase